MKMFTLKTTFLKITVLISIQISIFFIFNLNVILGNFSPYLMVSPNFVIYFDLIYLVFNLPVFFIIGTTLKDTISKLPLISSGGSIKIIQQFLIRFSIIFLEQLLINLFLFLKSIPALDILLIQVSLLPFYFLLNLVTGTVNENVMYLYIILLTGLGLVLTKLNIVSFFPGITQNNIQFYILFSIGLVGAIFYKTMISDYLKGDKV